MNEREDAVERAIRHYPEPLVDARELTDAVLEETDAFDDLADPRREVLDCLKVLRRTGEVVSHSPGSNAITWAHRERVIMDPPPRTPADHPDQIILDEAKGGGSENRQKPTIEPVLLTERHTSIDSFRQEDDAVAGVDDLPGGVDAGDAAAAIDAARQLVEDGGATKSEIVREVMPEHPLGYNVDDAIAKLDAGDRYRGAWWRRVVKPGLEAADDVDKPAPGRSEWKKSS